MDTRVVQVTNICPNINIEQLKTFLGFIGRVEQIRLYPERVQFTPGGMNSGNTKVCYAKFQKQEDAAVALHLTNTVFIDRALIVVPVATGIIPDEQEGLKNATQGEYAGYLTNPSVIDVFGQLDSASAMDSGMNDNDELSRTVYLDNLPAEAVSKPETLLDFCSQMGEVKYVRLAGDDPVQAAFVEFTSQTSAQEALRQDGVLFCEQPIRISLSNSLIDKPQLKSNSDAQKEIEAAMDQVRRAESLITAHASIPDLVPLPGSINKSAVRPRTKSRSPPPKRRSPTPPGKRSSRRESERESSRRRTRSRSPRRRSRTRSPDRSSRRRRSSKSRERSIENRRKEREKSREREKEREKERERERAEREKEREKEKERERERDKEREKVLQEREREREKRDKERSKEKSRKQKDRDRSESEEKSSHKKKHKKEKKRKHKDTSRSRSRDKDTKNNGNDSASKTKSRRSKTPESQGGKSPGLKSDAMETSP